MYEPEIVRYPLFLDMHVHLRQPGTNQAETIGSGTLAAMLGGVGYVFDMPNNPGHPTWQLERVQEKHAIARQDAHVFYGAYAGWQPDGNVDVGELKRMAPYVVGKKGYLTFTTENDRLWTPKDFREADLAFHEAAPDKPLMIHPDNIDQVEEYMVDIAKGVGHHVHICHVNDPAVAELVARFRDDGYPASSEATTHHLTKTSHDWFTHGKFAEMMPPLAPQHDTEKLLWQVNQGIIDAIATDHAPHSYDKKMTAEYEGGDCFGVPGVELAFAVLRYQVKQGRLKEERLVDAMSATPARIMGIKPSTDSYSEWSMTNYRIDAESAFASSGSEWTPFLGQMATGSLVRMVIEGQEVYNRDEGTNIVPLAHYGFDPIITDRVAA